MTATLDTAKADAFAESMVMTLNQGAIALMISVGHRTGLFDTLAQLPPASSQHIADAAGLNERYVREWLGAMTSGGIVEIHAITPEATTYRLPEEHAAFLTRAASPNNIAAFMQYIGLLGAVEDQIVTCFYEGGGVPYREFGRFHQVMAEDSGQTVVSALESHLLPLIPDTVQHLEAGIDVLDLGCGCGRAVNKLAARFPNSRFTGIDLSEEAITRARMEAQVNGLTNVTFAIQDAATFDAIEAYDLITTFDAVHDQARPDLVLANIYRALRPDGLYFMQDIRASSHVAGNLDHPTAPLLYTVSCMHCMTVSLAAGGLGLGAMWGEELALEMLKAAGFGSVEIHQLAHDFQNNYYLVRKAS